MRADDKNAQGLILGWVFGSMRGMKDVFEVKAFYADTDAYGVVWHGNYLRWLEAGRIYYCEKATGYNLVELEKMDIVLPVAHLEVQYKRPVRLNDVVEVVTEVLESSRCSVTFKQTIQKDDVKYVEANVKVVAIHCNGALYRSIPDVISKIIEK